jgi:hypothetical protein
VRIERAARKPELECVEWIRGTNMAQIAVLFPA